MEIMKTDEHLKLFLGTLKSWADIYQRNGLGEYDDCFQEASMVYLKACDEFNPKRAKFNTFLNVKLKTNMYDMLRKKKKHIKCISLDDGDEIMESILDSPHNAYPLKRMGVVMQLRYRGYTMDAIGKILGVSRQSTYNLLKEEQLKVEKDEPFEY